MSSNSSSVSFRARLGTLVVSSSMITTNEKPGALIIFPDQAKKLAVEAFVHLHRATRRFGEDLTGKNIIFVKYSGRSFKLGGREFTVIPESACLAVLEEEHSDEAR